LILVAGGLLLFLVIWFVILQRWQLGVVLLLLYLPFAGVVTMALYPSSLPILFKDFYFVIPAYLAFWLSRKDAVATARVPAAVSITMLALASMVSIQAFNPGLASWLVAAIGAKVWLFYLPLLFLAFAIVESRYDLIQLLRLMVVVTWIPCGVGILEWLSCMTFGYEETMFAIYGQAAEGATQNFARFEVGGEFYRIPSTFTFVTQYFGYTLSMIVPAYMLSKLDESGGWRKFAVVTMWLAVMASFMSGARAAYVFVPMLLLLTFWLDGWFRGGVKVMFILAPVLLLALYIAGIDPGRLYELVYGLMVQYSSDIAEQGLLEAMISSPWGTGTGMNTGPARYAFDNPESFIGIENYYAKAVVELGVPGLLIVVGLFAVIAKRGYAIHSQLRDTLRSCTAAILAFIVIIVLNSFKGWQIDLDPVNVYFWIFSGFMLKLGHLDVLPLASETEARCGGVEAPRALPA
jgi:hypothetical protein